MRRTARLTPLLAAFVLLAGCSSAAPHTSQAESGPAGSDAIVDNAPHAAPAAPQSGDATPPPAATSSAENAMEPDPAPPQAHASGPLTLIPGGHAQLPDGSRLAYLQLVNDSRCPPGVQCIWAGNAEILMRWTPAHGGHGEDFPLNTSTFGGKPVSATVGTFEIHLRALERGTAPAATFEIKPISP